MTFALFLAGAAERHALIKRNILSDFSRLADYNSRAVIYKKSVANRRAGMNLNSRQEAAKVRDKPRRYYPAAFEERVRNSVQPNSVKSRITQHNFKHTLCRRVALKDNSYILFDARKKFHQKCAAENRKSRLPPLSF